MSNDKVQSIMALVSNYALSVASSLDTEEECEAHRAAIESAIREAIAAPGVAQGWEPIESAPKDGEFLVYMPDERTKIQAARWHPNVKTIGGNFHFDLTAPTHWMPLPAAPSTAAQPIKQPPPPAG